MNIQAAITLAVAGFTRPMGEAQTATANFTSSARVMAREVAQLAGGYIGASAAINRVKASIAMGGQLKDLSNRTGESVRNLVMLRQAFDETGIGAESVGRVIALMQRSLAGINEDGKNTSQAFHELGVSQATLRELSPLQQIKALSTAFQGISNESDRTALAMRIFGRSGAELKQLFAEPKLFNELVADMGGVAWQAQKTSDSFDKLGDDSSRIKAKFGAVFSGVAETLAPTIARIQSKLSSFSGAKLGQDIGASVVAISNMVAGFGHLVAVTPGLTTAVKALGTAYVAVKIGQFAQGLALATAAKIDATVAALGQARAEVTAASAIATETSLLVTHTTALKADAVAREMASVAAWSANGAPVKMAHEIAAVDSYRAGAAAAAAWRKGGMEVGLVTETVVKGGVAKGAGAAVAMETGLIAVAGAVIAAVVSPVVIAVAIVALLAKFGAEKYQAGVNASAQSAFNTGTVLRANEDKARQRVSEIDSPEKRDAALNDIDAQMDAMRDRKSAAVWNDREHAVITDYIRHYTALRKQVQGLADDYLKAKMAAKEEAESNKDFSRIQIDLTANRAASKHQEEAEDFWSSLETQNPDDRVEALRQRQITKKFDFDSAKTRSDDKKAIFAEADERMRADDTLSQTEARKKVAEEFEENRNRLHSELFRINKALPEAEKTATEATDMVSKIKAETEALGAKAREQWGVVRAIERELAIRELSRQITERTKDPSALALATDQVDAKFFAEDAAGKSRIAIIENETRALNLRAAGKDNDARKIEDQQKLSELTRSLLEANPTMNPKQALSLATKRLKAERDLEEQPRAAPYLTDRLMRIGGSMGGGSMNFGAIDLARRSAIAVENGLKYWREIALNTKLGSPRVAVWGGT